MICLYKETILVSGYLTWQDEGPKTTSPIEAENANGIDSLPISGKGFMATGFKAFEGRLAARVLLQGFQLYSARRLCNKAFLNIIFEMYHR